MYTFASDAGIAAVKDAQVAEAEPFTMELAGWSAGGRKEISAIIRNADREERELILGSVAGGATEETIARHDRVRFVLSRDAFAAMVDVLARAADSEDPEEAEAACELLGGIAESLGVEWV